MKAIKQRIEDAKNIVLNSSRYEHNFVATYMQLNPNQKINLRVNVGYSYESNLILLFTSEKIEKLCNQIN